MLSCELVSGQSRTAIIVAYLPPNDLDDLPHLDEALRRFPKLTPIVLGDLNVDLDRRITRATRLNATLAPYGFLDLLKHYKQRPKARNLFTYRQVLETGKCRQSRCDYILSPDRRLFESVQIRKQRYYTSDHRMVVAKYLLQPTKSHLAYLRGRKAVPFKMPYGPLTELDYMFQQVLDQVPTPPSRTDPRRTPWISETTCKIWDARCILHRTQRNCQTESRRLKRQYLSSLNADRKRRTEEVGAKLQLLMTEGNIRGAYMEIHGWWREQGFRAPTPNREDLPKVSNDFQTLYTASPPHR